ncbi:MAG: hypothetical protein WDO24_24575 [Pseudomonadota bacterium]
MPPRRACIVGAIDTRAVGLAVIALGGGRTRADARIDHAVGLTEIAGIGEPVGADRPLCLCHARDDAAAARAAALLLDAFRSVMRHPPPRRSSPSVFSPRAPRLRDRPDHCGRVNVTFSGRIERSRSA